jgi:hypothetical protein
MTHESFPSCPLAALRSGNGWSFARRRGFFDAMDRRASGEGTGDFMECCADWGDALQKRYLTDSGALPRRVALGVSAATPRLEGGR